MMGLTGYSLINMVNIIIYLIGAMITFNWLHKLFKDSEFYITVTFAIFWPLFYLVLVIVLIMQLLEFVRKN